VVTARVIVTYSGLGAFFLFESLQSSATADITFQALNSLVGGYLFALGLEYGRDSSIDD
jgi:hypothetical protein